MPDLPTLAESGLPGFDATLSYGLLAPAGTPQPIVQKLNKALNEALADEAARKRSINEGAEPEPGMLGHSSRRTDHEGNEMVSGHPVGRLAAEVNGYAGQKHSCSCGSRCFIHRGLCGGLSDTADYADRSVSSRRWQ